MDVELPQPTTSPSGLKSTWRTETCSDNIHTLSLTHTDSENAESESKTRSCPFFQKLRPKGLELQQGELGDLVEQEMAATSAAVESAAARIEVGLCVSLCVCVQLLHTLVSP